MIKSLRMRNFRRFLSEDITFSNGITFIEGENNAGKTTLFMAIEYGLFGVVQGFASQAALVHPGKDKFGVELVYTGRDGFDYKLQRVHVVSKAVTRSSATGHYTLKQITDEGEVYLESSDFPKCSEEDLQLKVFETLGISRRLFNIAVNIRQGVITHILEGDTQLDIVLGVSAAVASEKQVRAIALNFEKETTQIDTLKASVLTLSDEKKELIKHQKGLDKKIEISSDKISKLKLKQTKINELQNFTDKIIRPYQDFMRKENEWNSKIMIYKSNTDNYSKLIKEFSGVEELSKRIPVIEKAISENNKKIDKKTIENDKLIKQNTDLDQKFGDLNGKIKRRDNIPEGEATCETCGAVIDRDRVNKELREWNTEKESIVKQKEVISESLKKINNEVKEWRNKNSDLSKEESTLNAQKKQLDTLTRQLNEQLGGIKEGEKGLSTEVDLLKSIIVDYNQSINDWHTSQKIEIDKNLLLDEDPTIGEIEPLKVGEYVSDPVFQTNNTKMKSVMTNTIRIVDKIKEMVTEIKVSMKAEGDMLGEYNQMLRDLKPRLDKIGKDITRLEGEIYKLERKALAGRKLRDLSAAFKELQTSLRDSASKQLGKKTHKYHKLLTKKDEYLDLRIDSKKYITYVRPRDIDEEVPAHSYQGGGHKLLLGLAFKLAIANFVTSPSFILLDEPTYGLDPENKKSLFEEIGKVTKSQQLLIITHQKEGKILGNDLLKVIKTGDLSTIEAVK